MLRLSLHPAFLVIPLLAFCARGQDAESALPTLDVPYASVKPALEAKADDPAWEKAARLPKLTLSRGSPDDAQPVPTQVRLLWDEQFLYVRFDCEDHSLYLPEKGHDALIYRGDVAEVFIDPKGDSRQFVEILCNANNDVFDQQILLTAEPRSDENLMLHPEVSERDHWSFTEWTMEGLRTVAAKDEKDGQLAGWRVEMAIPAKPLLRRLGLATFRPMVLRANLLRYDWQPPPVEGQKWDLWSVNWSPVVQGCPHKSPAAMGFLKLRPKLPDAHAPK